VLRNRLTRAYAELIHDTVEAAGGRAGRADSPYRIQARLGEDAADIFLYAEIGFWGIDAQSVVRDLSDLGAVSTLNVHISSPGGDVFDGVAIYRALRDHPATVNVQVDSMAASIASVIAQAADEGRLVMARHSMMMIHEPWAFVVGDAADMRAMATALDKMGEQIAGIYAERAGGTRAEWRERMQAETWLSDEEAVALGLADAIAEDEATENSFDLSIFRNAPKDAKRLARGGGAGDGSRPSGSEPGNEGGGRREPDWRTGTRLAVEEAAMQLLEVS
jgi:ATP-dependent protease ClpP protease subunit